MFSSSLLSSSATILVLVCACNVLLPSVHSKCLCSVTKNGEYCGTELNALNSENECLKNIYFCGDSNRNREAAQLVQCPQGKECDIKTFMSNACLKDVECKCPKNLKSGSTYCGAMLNGKHCSPNVTFSCPYLSVIFLPTPVDVCMFGCQNGTCLPAPPAGA